MMKTLKAIRLLVCGDRKWTDRRAIEECISGFGEITMIIEGEAPGADTLARLFAVAKDIPVKSCPADWKRYGRAAGPIRNVQMLEEGQPDVVLAFHKDIARSRGTRDMVNRAVQARIPVYLYNGVTLELVQKVTPRQK